MKIYTAQYMMVTASTYDPYDDDYSYSRFMSKRTDIISTIVGLIKRGASCEKLTEAFTPLFFNESRLNESHELELKEDENSVQCPYEPDEREVFSDRDVWIKGFDINAMFDVDYVIPEIVPSTGRLYSLGWGQSRWNMKPVEVVLESVEDDTWGTFRRPELFHVAASLVQEFYLDGGRNSKDMFNLIENIRPLHQLAYFGDMASRARDIAAKCEIPFDEFLTSKTVNREAASPEVVPMPDMRSE